MAWLCDGLRGVFVGSGSDGMNEQETCEAVLTLARASASGEASGTTPAEGESGAAGRGGITVLYIGVASYDLDGPRARQTARFRALGCSITSLDLALATPPEATACETVAKADVVVISGGNTVFAIDRLKATGVDALLRAAMERGCVLTGGSCGAICWFDAGHSDSMDPDSFKGAMLAAADGGGDESSGAPGADGVKDWEYIRAPCLGFLPGLVCPHFDKVQSNGALRATDFDAMMLRHPGEVGIGIDHWAALVVRGDHYDVLPLAGKPGSVAPDGSFSATQSGRPGVWVKRVVGGVVQTQLAPPSGRLSELLEPAAEIVVDERVALCRTRNPSNP